MSKPAAVIATAAVIAASAAGCGTSSSSSSAGPTKAANPNAPEVNPAGDIPDNQAYVRYSPHGGGFSVKVPEGWSRSVAGGAVTFTDKLNAIRIERRSARAPLTGEQAKQVELPRLARSVKGFQAGSVATVSRDAGRAIRITYVADAPPNPVTGRAGKDAVERYVFFHRGRDLILTLSGPKGADNVDPWKTVTNSLAWSR